MHGCNSDLQKNTVHANVACKTVMYVKYLKVAVWYSKTYAKYIYVHCTYMYVVGSVI